MILLKTNKSDVLVPFEKLVHHNLRCVSYFWCCENHIARGNVSDYITQLPHFKDSKNEAQEGGDKSLTSCRVYLTVSSLVCPPPPPPIPNAIRMVFLVLSDRVTVFAISSLTGL